MGKGKRTNYELNITKHEEIYMFSKRGMCRDALNNYIPKDI